MLVEKDTLRAHSSISNLTYESTARIRRQTENQPSWSPQRTKPTSELALTNAREAFFLGQYTAVVGPWFDIFDSTNSYFSTEVPLQALRHRLLRLTCLGSASKQYSLVTSHGRHDSLTYYDEGLQALYAALGDDRAKKNPATFASCLLIAFYEMIESNATGWFLHLKGTHDLVLFNGWNGSVGGLEQACFWIYCRMIILACLSLGEPTPLNISNVIPDNTYLRPSSWTFDPWGNKAVYLLTNVHNFLSRNREGGTDTDLLRQTEEWKQLKRDLVEHEATRPSICYPIAILPPHSEERPFEVLRYLNGSVGKNLV